MAGEMLELMMGRDKAQLGRIVRRFTQVIERSFAADKSTITRNETKRRFRMLETTYRDLRAAPFLWSWPRISNALPHALRNKLDGVPWSPETARRMWSPDD